MGKGARGRLYPPPLKGTLFYFLPNDVNGKNHVKIIVQRRKFFVKSFRTNYNKQRRWKIRYRETYVCGDRSINVRRRFGFDRLLLLNIFVLFFYFFISSFYPTFSTLRKTINTYVPLPTFAQPFWWWKYNFLHDAQRHRCRQIT